MTALEKKRAEVEEMRKLVAEERSLNEMLEKEGKPKAEAAKPAPMKISNGQTFEDVCDKLDALHDARLVLADGTEIKFGPAHQSGSEKANATRSISGKATVPGIPVELSVSASFTWPNSGKLPRRE